MKPCAFEMHRPRDLTEALELLERHGDDARLIAGGQSLVPMMNLRMATPGILVDLNTVSGLSGIRRDGDVIRIGAMTRQQSLLDNELIRQHVPLMAEAVRHVGHYSTRSRGTVGGSLANADPSSELALVAVTLGAEVTVRGPAQTRTVAAQEFFLDALKTALQPTEILTELAVAMAPAGSTIAFREHARRHGDFAIASAAAQFSRKEGVLRVGLGAVGPVPVACRRIEDAFRKGQLPQALDDLIAAEIADVDATSDVHTSADYRRKLAAVCLADCVRELLA
jgi:CO/xanthine dehydrogenase FAD-binding subunit